jgi:hypothetical protein
MTDSPQLVWFVSLPTASTVKRAWEAESSCNQALAMWIYCRWPPRSIDDEEILVDMLKEMGAPRRRPEHLSALLSQGREGYQPETTITAVLLVGAGEHRY